MSIGAGLIGSGVLGAASNIFGGIMGANAQTKAANNAIAAQKQYYQQAQGNLQPFITGGTQAFNTLLGLTGANNGTGSGPLTAKFQPTMDQLAQTPGYQFTLGQGLKGVQNSNAARGLGGSGEALAGAANYTTGLASTTYQQQFQNYLQQNQQIYNQLAGLANPGLSAANSLAGLGMGAANQIGGQYANIGNAQANMWGTIGSNVGNAVQSPFQTWASGAIAGTVNPSFQQLGWPFNTAGSNSGVASAGGIPLSSSSIASQPSWNAY